MNEATEPVTIHEGECNEACGAHCADTVPVQPEPQVPLNEAQFRKLRGQYFTVRHDLVGQCGHKIDRMNEPSIGCEWCWWTWFSGHGELIQTTDRALQEQGKYFVIKMRGKRYLKYFLRYMSTLARFKKEQDATNTESTESNIRSLDSDQSGDDRSIRESA